MKQSIISFMTSSAFLLFANGAKASSVVVNMDKGTLLVELASIEKAYDLKVVKPASCHDLPRVTDRAGVVNISHKDLEECPEGSVVTLTVNPALVTSVNLKLENGLAGVNNFKTFYKSLQSLKSSVNVGIVETKSEKISLRKIGYTGYTAESSNSAASSNLSLLISLQNGVLSFR